METVYSHGRCRYLESMGIMSGKQQEDVALFNCIPRRCHRWVDSTCFLWFLRIDEAVQVSIILTIALRIATTILGKERSQHLENVIDVTQLVNLGLSLLANITATSVICYKAW